MRLLIQVIFIIVLCFLAVLIVNDNPEPMTINITFLEIRSTKGVVIVSTFSIGYLIAILSLISRGAGALTGDDKP